MSSRILKLFVPLAALVILNGCGGGGGGGGSNSGGQDNGTALISWTPPTENTDGSSLSGDLAGYRIYYGNAPGDYTNSVIVEGAGMSSYMVENLAEGDWYFAMTAYNTLGIESSYSDEVYKAVS